MRAEAQRRIVDVLGFLDGDFGLAVAARNSVRALSETGRLGSQVGVSVEISQMSPVRRRAALWRRQALPRLSRALRAAASPGSKRINLFHMNPLEIAAYACQWRAAAKGSASNVCVPFWELPLAPESWRPILTAMDAVMAPTRFVESACASAIPPERVLHYPQAVFLPEGVRPEREKWGLGSCRTSFIVSFDVGSDIERKNPSMAVEAFQRAFLAEEDVTLVVKMKPWAHPEYAAQAEALKVQLASDRRIRVVDRALSYAEVLSLYASCDVMISLHRSEGLGLHLMEAMSLGKVVIGTGWSGNMDFMVPGNSWPVAYRLVPLRTSHEHYQSEIGRAGQVWAEPDLGEAVAALRALHLDKARRQALGLAAAQDMAARRAAMLSGKAFDALQSLLGDSGARDPGLGKAVHWTRLQALAREGHRATRS